MSTNEDEWQEDAAIRQKVRLPGWLLILLGILNVMVALYLIQMGIQIWKMTPAEIRASQEETVKQAKLIGWGDDEQYKHILETPPAQVQSGWVAYFLSWAGVALVVGFLIAYGGFNLRSLNSYRLALTGAILVMVPIISPLGCCGLGQLAGIWALVVLMNREVRSAFP